MNINEIMKLYADPKAVLNLTTIEILAACLVVTVLGMGITYIVLILLKYACELMSKIVVRYELRLESNAAKITASSSGKIDKVDIVIAQEPEEDEEELIAVMTAAVASLMSRSVSSIQIKSIAHIRDQDQSWSRMGRMDQMASRQ